MNLTRTNHLGYADPTVAKSTVGISLLEKPKVQKHLHKLCAFFMPTFYGGLYGSTSVRRFLWCGKANSVQLTTQSLVFFGGELIIFTKGGCHA